MKKIKRKTKVGFMQGFALDEIGAFYDTDFTSQKWNLHKNSCYIIEHGKNEYDI